MERKSRIRDIVSKLKFRQYREYLKTKKERIVVMKKKRIKENLNKELEFLYSGIKKAQERSGIFGLIDFFNFVSRFENKEIVELTQKTFKKNRELVASLNKLRKLIRQNGPGFYVYGMNRARKGEEVTADKVFLGNIFGLFTHSASYWLERKEKLKKQYMEDETISVWDIIHNQAVNFLNTNGNFLRERIEIIRNSHLS